MALYKCKCCGEYLTELDVEFAERLKQKEHVAGKCCKCIMGEKQIALAERNIKKEDSLSVIRGILPILTYLIIVPIFFCAMDLPDVLRGVWGTLLAIGATVMVGIPYLYYMANSQDQDGYPRDAYCVMYFLWALIIDIAICFRASIIGSIIISLMLIAWLVLSITTHIVCGKDALRISFNKEFDDDTTPTGYHYETMYRGDGISETRKVNEYSGDGSGFIIFFFPIWGVVYSILEPLIKENKYNKAVKKYCNLELFNVYRTVYLSRNWEINLKEEEYNERYREYMEQLDTVYSKYNYYGEEVLKKELSKIQFYPPETVINNIRYYIIDMGRKKEVYCKKEHTFKKIETKLVVCKENGKLQTKILYNNRFLYTKNEDLKETWEDLGNESRIITFSLKK